MNNINNYIDFGKLFLDLYNDQEEILIKERKQAQHFEKILQFKQHAYKDFEIIPEECNYDTKEIVLFFGYDFNDANESCSQSTTAEYVIVFDTIIEEFTGCRYEQG